MSLENGQEEYLDSSMRIRKAPSHITQYPMIGARRPHHIRILSFTIPVPWTHDRCSVAITEWQWLKLIGDRINLAIIWISMTGCKWLVLIGVVTEVCLR